MDNDELVSTPTKRSVTLERLLHELTLEIECLRAEHSTIAANISINVSSLALLAANPSYANPSADLYAALERSGFKGRRLLDNLTLVLEEDVHLRKCCVNIHRLAGVLDIFVSEVLESPEKRDLLTADFHSLFLEFASHLYDCEFTALSFTHLFNFACDRDSIDFGDFSIERLPQNAIVEILGEYTPTSMLHFRDTGDFFVKTASTDLIQDDVRWLIDQNSKAANIARVFQYFKDGIVHTSYTAHYFLPTWVNRVRKFSLLYVGEIRRTSYELGQRPFRFEEADSEAFRRWWTAFSRPEINTKFGNDRNNLGNTILAAGTFFESSHTQTEELRRLIDLSIALETLFSPYNQNEIAHQLSQLSAQFLGDSPDDKKRIFREIKTLYGKRCKLLHGSPTAHSETFVSTTELDRFGGLIRRALIRFIILYLNGEENHKNVIQRLQNSLFDPEEERTIKTRSDIELFLAGTET